MSEPRIPGRGSTFLGVAAAAFATGPCMVSLIGLASMVADANYPGRWANDFGKLPTLMIYASLFCLIGPVPAACLNAYALSRAARQACAAGPCSRQSRRTAKWSGRTLIRGTEVDR